MDSREASKHIGYIQELTERAYLGQASAQELEHLRQICENDNRLRHELIWVWGLIEGSRLSARQGMKQRLMLLHQ